jgi:hypothetical protein
MALGWGIQMMAASSGKQTSRVVISRGVGCVVDGAEVVDAIDAAVDADAYVCDGARADVVDVVARVVARRPGAVVVVVVDDAAPPALARLGAILVRRPCDPASLAAALAPGPTRTLEALARALVGVVDLKDAQAAVRRAMVEEALRQGAGNYADAGRRLGITRQGLASALRDLDLTPAKRGR